jgi:hypothetical protein
MQNAPESVMFVLLSSSNRWARGRSMFSAASALVKAGGKRKDKVFGIMVCNDPEPFIDSTGRICYGGAEAPNAYTVELGNLGKVGGLIA